MEGLLALAKSLDSSFIGTKEPFFEGERIKEKEMRGFIRMNRGENPQKEEYL